MWRFGGIVSAAAIVFVCATAPACGLTGKSAPKVAIPETYRISSRTYTLLYSTLGYESAATKRVLIRQNDSTEQVSEGLKFNWRLVDDKGRAGVGRAGDVCGEGVGHPVLGGRLLEREEGRRLSLAGGVIRCAAGD